MKPLPPLARRRAVAHGHPSAAARSAFIVWAALLLVTWSIPILAYYPGVYSPDVVDQLTQAITGAYADWHPPLMAAWWSVLIHASGTPSALLWFHHALLLATLLLLATMLAREGARWPLALLVPVPLLPTIVNFSGALWKDVGCAFALALAAVAAALARGGRRVVFVPLTLLGCLYAAGVRVNAIPAVLPILLLALWPAAASGRAGGHPRARSVAAAVAITLVFAVAPPVFASRVLHARKMYVPALLQLTDVAGIHHLTGAGSLPAFSLSHPRVTGAEIDEQYERSATNGSVSWLFWPRDGKPPPLRLPRDEAESSAARQAWIGAVVREPRAYLRHRARFMARLLRVGDSEPFEPFARAQDPDEVRALFASAPAAVKKQVFEDLSRQPPFAATCRTVVEAIFAATWQSRPFRGWFWVLVDAALLALAVALRHRAPRLAGFAAASCGSGLLYCASYFPTMPAPDFRYLYWTVLSGILSSIAVVASLWVASFPPATTSSR